MIIIKSFVADSASGNPVKDAVKNATNQADNYIGERGDDEITARVLSISTHIVGHGDYFSYIITMVLDLVDDEVPKGE